MQTLSTLAQAWLSKPLSQKQKTLLNHLLKQPDQTALSSITGLSERFTVSASSLTRLAQKLGYDGFPAFQTEFKNHIHQTSSPYHERLALNQSTQQNKSSALWSAHQAAIDEVQNINHALNSLDDRQFSHIAERLSKAPRVRFHGLRQMHSLASFFCYGLSMIRGDVALLGNDNLGFTHPLADMDENDLLIVLGCEPHTHSTVDVAYEATRRKIGLIAVTDSLKSPLATGSHDTLVLPTTGHYYINNLASWMVIIEGLLSNTAHILGERALKQLDDRVMLYRRLGTKTMDTSRTQHYE